MKRQKAVIASERTSLHPFATSDADELLGVFRDPEVRRYLLDDEIVSAAWVHDEIAASDRRFARSGTGLWSIRLGRNAAIIGFVGFREFFDPPQLQLLYGLLPEYWGKGLATEVAVRICDHAFRELGLLEISAATDSPNQASAKVLLRLEMKQVRTSDDGTAFFVLTRDAWFGARRNVGAGVQRCRPQK